MKKNGIFHLSFVICHLSLLVLLASAASAQQIGNPTTQQGITGTRGVYAIRNARIVTVSGPEIENGTIVIRNGKIEAVGANATGPRGAQGNAPHRWARDPRALDT